MPQTPQQAIEEIRRAADRLGSNTTVHWSPGGCDLPSDPTDTSGAGGRICTGDDHPRGCDRAFELGDYGPFPAKPTAKHVADAVDGLRADLSETLGAALVLLTGQQRQLDALSAKHAQHRHKVGEGHFSDRAE